MRIGFSLPFTKADGSSLSAEDVMRRARLIEDLGFGGIFVGDQLGRGSTRPDPLMWCLTAAMGTQEIQVGTAVVQVPLRRTLDLAQRLLTVHILTKGRFLAGLGSGSTKRDFDASEVDYEQRFSILNRELPAIQRLMRGEQVRDADLKVWPDVAGGGPPIAIGSWVSGLWVKRAARDYDAWMTSGAGPGGTTFRNLKEGILIYREHGGKRAMIATVPVDLSRESPSLTDDARYTLQCGPAEARERIERARELGYDDVLLRGDDHTDEQVIEVAETLGLQRRPRTP